MGGSRMEGIPCPQCGRELDPDEDVFGVVYQCTNIACLGFFDADEVEPEGSTIAALEAR